MSRSDKVPTRDAPITAVVLLYDAASPTSCSSEDALASTSTYILALPPQECKRKADMNPALSPARPHPITPPPRALASRVLHVHTIPPQEKPLTAMALAPRALAVKALAAMAPDAKAALVVDTRRLVELPPFESPHA